MEQMTKFVDFAFYCPRCVHRDDPDDCDACNECLNEPARENTMKPIKFKEAGDKKKKGKKSA